MARIHRRTIQKSLNDLDNQDGETMETVRLFFWVPKSLQMVIAAMKLKDTWSWKKNYDQPRQHIKKQRPHFANKGLSSQSYGFFQ